MTRYTDRKLLRDDQYADSSNLDARAALHREYGTAERGWFDWVFDRFVLPADARVLEVGCGPGYLWRETADRVPDEWRVTLTDLSEGMVAEAREALAGDPRYAFDVADAESLPFPDDAFDAVVANHMLYHVPDRDAALAEFRRVLEPGGRLYAATNGERSMRRLRELQDRFAGNDVASLIDHGFTLESGESQLADHFSEVTLDRFDHSLVVTEAEPIVAYAASSPRSDLDEAGLRALGEHVESIIADAGAVEIGKEQGLFVARP